MNGMAVVLKPTFPDHLRAKCLLYLTDEVNTCPQTDTFPRKASHIHILIEKLTAIARLTLPDEEKQRDKSGIE
jgi:hypothetical protein